MEHEALEHLHWKEPLDTQQKPTHIAGAGTVWLSLPSKRLVWEPTMNKCVGEPAAHLLTACAAWKTATLRMPWTRRPLPGQRLRC